MSRPFVTLLMAMTVDGKIARNSAHAVNWTSKEDKAFFVAKTKEAGAVIMGRRTYDTIKRPLPGRFTLVVTSRPESQTPIAGTLEFMSGSPREALKELSRRGYTKAVLVGGAQLNGAFLKEELIDEMFITIEPRIFGEGLGLFSEISCDVSLELLRMEKLSQDVMVLHYKVKYVSERKA